MQPLKDMSRKSIVAVSLLVWFLPSCFLLFQLAKNGTTAAQRLLYLPLMYGFTLVMWIRALLQQRWCHWTLAVIIAIGLPAGLVFFMLRASNRRPVILAVGLIVSCALTAAAYCLLRA